MTDDGFCEKAERQRLQSGAVALTVLIREERLYVAWAGDAQALLGIGGQAVALNDPHKPERPVRAHYHTFIHALSLPLLFPCPSPLSLRLIQHCPHSYTLIHALSLPLLFPCPSPLSLRPIQHCPSFPSQDEKARIEESGGLVVFYGTWRVNGMLSVARAIGDCKQKQQIIAEPDVDVFYLDGSPCKPDSTKPERIADFLVMGCDGLFDVLTPQQIVEAVEEHLKTNETGRDGTAKALTQLAIAKGSSDNVSVIVVFFSHK